MGVHPLLESPKPCRPEHGKEKAHCWSLPRSLQYPPFIAPPPRSLDVQVGVYMIAEILPPLYWPVNLLHQLFLLSFEVLLSQLHLPMLLHLWLQDILCRSTIADHLQTLQLRFSLIFQSQRSYFLQCSICGGTFGSESPLCSLCKHPCASANHVSFLEKGILRAVLKSASRITIIRSKRIFLLLLSSPLTWHQLSISISHLQIHAWRVDSSLCWAMQLNHSLWQLSSR